MRLMVRMLSFILAEAVTNSGASATMCRETMYLPAGQQLLGDLEDRAS
jgi:hypothetical protein